jgi:alpha-mannosidase
MTVQSDRFSRRQFLITSTAATVGAASLGVRASAADRSQDEIKSAKSKVLHIIGYSHIDAAWLWPWRDGSNLALTTFRSALDRMNETPGFRYIHSSTIHYQWVERADPKMFEEVKARIREGRWEVVGGWPVEPDINIPSTESFVRHCLYGKEYCQRVLGVDVKVGLNPDSFGHAAGLPSILKKSGYNYYVFMRPREDEMKLPFLFWWEAPDGSRVLTLRIWRGYSSPASRIPQAAQIVFPPGFDHGAFFMGVGDHGGAVTKEQIKQVLEMQKDSGLPELRWSTVSEFLAEVEKSPAMAKLPVIRTELQHHSRGCYSAYGEGKQQNRRAERWLGQAETLSVAAAIDHGHAYPGAEYKAAWAKVNFNQFHDLMAGTALYGDYQDARDQIGWACETAHSNRVEALESIARRVDTRSVSECAVFLFNPLPWPRKTIVEYNQARNPGQQPVGFTYLQTKDKEKVPLQWRPPESMTLGGEPKLSALIDLPACGYKVLELVRGPVPDTPPIKTLGTTSETGFGLGSLPAPDGKELLASAVGLVVITDTSDTWSHGVDKFRQEMGRPTFISSEVMEDGPIVRVTRQRARWMSSEIVMDILQYNGVEAVQLKFVIDWHEHEQILKLEIPTALASPRVFAKVPGAAIERQPNGEEEPYQDWVAVQGKIGSGDYTVGLINDSTYSYDCLSGLLRTILIRSAPFARHNPNRVPYNDSNAWQDQGRQERRFWLVRGKGSYTALNLDRFAEEMQTPAEYVMDSAHEGSEVWKRSFLQVSPRNVWVTAIKRAESGKGTIIRMQERSGKVTEVTLEIPDLVMNRKVSLQPWEIKTLLITRGKGKIVDLNELNLLER